MEQVVNPLPVTAVVVSRMNRPLGPVIDSILPHVQELIVARGSDGVWERWEAAARAKFPVVYTQDDDATVPVGAVLAEYRRGFVTCNMPADHRKDYPDGIALVGWGCVFDRAAVDPETIDGGPFQWYDELFGRDQVFTSECDRVFTALSRLHLVDLPFTHEPAAFGNDRMGRRGHHGNYLREIRSRIARIRAKAQ